MILPPSPPASPLRGIPAQAPRHAPIGPLALAYGKAHYRIDATPSLVLQIAHPQPGLACLHQQHHCDHSVILTACNPRSRCLRPAANARRLRALQRTLMIMGRLWLPSMGLDPEGHWPDEPGCWIPGLSRAQGLQLARQFGQNAMVWCPEDAIAQLVWVPQP